MVGALISKDVFLKLWLRKCFKTGMSRCLRDMFDVFSLHKRCAHRLATGDPGRCQRWFNSQGMDNLRLLQIRPKYA